MIILSCCSLWIYDYLIHPVLGAQLRVSPALCLLHMLLGEFLHRGEARGVMWARKVSQTHFLHGFQSVRLDGFLESLKSCLVCK